ncbi:MAG: hypothetical protein ABSG86_29475 [Thermoguttaceae bacterium]|jgi:hypothetical protein
MKSTVPYPLCQYCGRPHRYVHYLTHPGHPKIAVCAGCATLLTGTDCHKRERAFIEHRDAQTICLN